MFKVNRKTPERHQRRRSGVFIVNFEHILYLFLLFLLSRFLLAGENLQLLNILQ